MTGLGDYDENSIPHFSESVYRDAVTKLRILLEASEAAASIAAQDTSDALTSKVRQVNFDGSVDRNIDKRFRSRSNSQLHLNDQTSKQRRATVLDQRLLSTNSPRIEDERKRYNSWHNLAHPSGDNKSSSDSSTGNLQSLIKKQEIYIRQLEKETKFSREQLTKVLSQVQMHWPDPDVASKKNGFVPANEANEVLQKLQEENEFLRQSLNDRDGSTITNVLIEKLKKDNAILLQTLNQVRQESEENCRRENEAVEQVKLTVKVAEQATIEKQELEFEIDQLKSQIERQQGRIRSLIEEQGSKIEDERIILEKKYLEQINATRHEAEIQFGEIGRLQAEIDRQLRVENDLRRQLREREQTIIEIQEDSQKLLSRARLDATNLSNSRQDLEEKILAERLNHSVTCQDLQTDKAHLEVQLESVRARMKKTEEQLDSSREQILSLSELNAKLEREVSLQKIRINQMTSTQANDVVGALVSMEPNADFHGAGFNDLVVNKLKDFVRRQNRLISDLKDQNLKLADKLESTSTDYAHEIQDLQQQLNRTNEEKRKGLDEVVSLQAQCREIGLVHGKCLRMFETAEIEKQSLLEEASHLRNLLDKSQRESIKRQATIQRLQNKESAYGHREDVSSEKILSHAIIVERNGKISSPLMG